MDENSKKLEGYLKTLRQSGFSDDDIRKGLRKFGYSDDDIRKAIENDSKKLDEEIKDLQEKVRQTEERIKTYEAQIGQLEKQIKEGQKVKERLKSQQKQMEYKGDKDVIKMAEEIFDSIRRSAEEKAAFIGSAYLDFWCFIECREDGLEFGFESFNYNESILFSDYRLMPINNEEKRIQLVTDIAEMVVLRLNVVFPNMDIFIEDKNEYEDEYEDVHGTYVFYDLKGRYNGSIPQIVGKKLIGKKKRVRKIIIAKDPNPVREL